MRKRILIGLMALGMIWEVRARAADLYVPGSYTTIQSAVDAATSGDTIWVADGTYTGEGNKNLTWTGKHITVRFVELENDT